MAFSGPLWQLREWLGLENLCIMMIQRPDFVSEMIAFWTQFASTVLDRFLPHFCPDRVMIQEDMAYKQACLENRQPVFLLIVSGH